MYGFSWINDEEILEVALDFPALLCLQTVGTKEIDELVKNIRFVIVLVLGVSGARKKTQPSSNCGVPFASDNSKRIIHYSGTHSADYRAHNIQTALSF